MRDTIVTWLNGASGAWLPFATHGAWQAALAGTLALIIARVMRKRWSASFCYGVLLLALLKFLTPPMAASPTGVFSQVDTREAVAFVAPLLPVMTADTPVSTAIIMPPPDPVAGPVAQPVPAVQNMMDPSPLMADEPTSAVESAPILAPAMTHAAWFFMACMGGSLLFAGCVVFSTMSLQRLGKRARRVTAPEALAVLESVKCDLGMRRDVRLLVSPDHGSPLTYGFLRPTVVIPESLAGSLDTVEGRGILAHELAHHKRWDLWVIALENLALCVWWFHPLLWVLLRGLRKVREDCCDDAVLASGAVDGSEYSQGLLRAARGMVRPHGFLAPLGHAHALHPLGHRIRRIMDTSICRRPRLSFTALVFLAIAALAVLPGVRIVRAEGEAPSVAAAVENTGAVADGGKAGGVPASPEDPLAIQPVAPIDPNVMRPETPVSAPPVPDTPAPVQTVRFQGRVVDTQNRPVGNAFIALVQAYESLPGGYGEQIPVNWPDGSFDCTIVPAGIHTISVYQPMTAAESQWYNGGSSLRWMQQASQQPLILESGKDVLDYQIVIRPPAECVISGKVISKTGAPVKDIQINVNPRDFDILNRQNSRNPKPSVPGVVYSTRASADGFFQAYLSKMPLESQPAIRVDFGQYTITMNKVPWGSNLSFNEPEFSKIDGVFNDPATGFGVSDINIRVLYVVQEEKYINNTLQPSSTSTANDNGEYQGRFGFANVPCGKAALEFTMPDGRKQREYVDVTPEQSTLLDLKMKPPCILEGKALFPGIYEGESRSRFEIVRHAPEQSFGWFMMDKNGAFRVDMLPEGGYTLKFTHPLSDVIRGRADVTLRHGETTRCQAVIGGLGVIQGGLTQPWAAEQALILLREAGMPDMPTLDVARPNTLGAGEINACIVSPPEFAYRLPGVPAGEWEIIAYTVDAKNIIPIANRPFARKTVTIKEGESLTVDLDLKLQP